jgi:hypothetical protein
MDFVGNDAALDSILAMQLTVAWAGEGRCSPARPGWWDTDLIDEAGGGDFFARLLCNLLRAKAGQPVFGRS